MQLFPNRCHLSCSDRAGVNGKAEDGLRAAKTSSEHRCRLTCGVHKAASSQSEMQKVHSTPISGMVNFALSMKAANSVSEFHDAMRMLFQQRLVVYRGALPPQPNTEAWQFREATLQLYLGSDEGT